jgi:TPR repeat protein
VHSIANKTKNSAMTKVDALLRRAHRQKEAGKLRSAFRLMLNAAKLGDAAAQHGLAYYYDVGIGVKSSRSSALLWYRRAYRKGYSSAANNIGTISRDEGDTNRALIWFERAVRLGDADANLEIAKILLQEPKRVADAVPYLKRVVAARPRNEVTEASQEEATRLLKRIPRTHRV